MALRRDRSPNVLYGPLLKKSAFGSHPLGVQAMYPKFDSFGIAHDPIDEAFQFFGILIHDKNNELDPIKKIVF
jgi:hypothetical protein